MDTNNETLWALDLDLELCDEQNDISVEDEIALYDELFGCYPEDVLEQADTISIEELREPAPTCGLSVAGIAPTTPADTMLSLQGSRAFVTVI